MIKHKFLNSLIQIAVAIVIAVFCVALIQQLLFIPVGIQGPSMEPTIASSGVTAYIIKSNYTINVDDIIVFYRPQTEEAKDMENPAQKKFSLKEFFSNFLHLKDSMNTDFESFPEDADFICVIKRVIGVPGDTIEIKDAILYRNGEIVNDFPMSQKGENGVLGVDDMSPLEVEEGELFVLGDNRDNSYDSEDYGCINQDWILGKVIMLISRGSGFSIKFVD